MGVRVAVSVPVVVTRGLGLGERYHRTMLYYNITEVHCGSSVRKRSAGMAPGK
jgi:hypothetical protein